MEEKSQMDNPREGIQRTAISPNCPLPTLLSVGMGESIPGLYHSLSIKPQGEWGAQAAQEDGPGVVSSQWNSGHVQGLLSGLTPALGSHERLSPLANACTSLACPSLGSPCPHPLSSAGPGFTARCGAGYLGGTFGIQALPP